MDYIKIKAILTNALMNGDMQTTAAILAQLGIDPNIALTYMNAITPRIPGEVPANSLFDLLGATPRMSQLQPPPATTQQQQPQIPTLPQSQFKLNLKSSTPDINKNLYWQPGQTPNTTTTTSRKKDLISLLGL
ncbi:MAG: hypothetical protein ACTSSF_00485 [Candidatus Heimdallarchaeaceae archaeon]